ncbi:MAG TPA: PEP-CTERM sorting domain-containing protein [Bryobacteraceae bacterium]|jgi:hypothetical protein
MKTNKALLLVGAAILTAASAMAIPSTCASLNGADLNPGSLGSQLTSTVTNLSIDCTFNGLEFSNFAYNTASVSGTPSGWNITLVGESLINGYVALTFNPSLNGQNTPNSVQDAHLTFSIGGTTFGALLFNGGPGPSNVGEKICVGATAPDSLTGNCGADTVFGPMSANDNQTSTVAYGSQALVYVWKDIQVTSASGHNSSITEGFAVPEPMTFSMLGIGLLGLGLVRRKLQK